MLKSCIFNSLQASKTKLSKTSINLKMNKLSAIFGLSFVPTSDVKASFSKRAR